MNYWKKDKDWADRFLREIKRILGENLIGPAPVKEDIERNTDLIVLRMEAVRIGCRIRRPNYRAPFGHEFTIRCSRPTGMKTELAKIIEGWGNYFLYGFADDAERILAQWILLSLNHFRLWWSQYLVKNQGRMPGRLLPNKNGSSEFRAFRVTDLMDVGGIINHMGLDQVLYSRTTNLPEITKELDQLTWLNEWK